MLQLLPDIIKQIKENVRNDSTSNLVVLSIEIV